MPLDPTTPTHNDAHYDDPPEREAGTPAGSRDPVTDSGEEPIRTLLWTAATYRPLEELAALVMLLKRSDEVPNPGDEALRVAAVARPIDEVMRLVAILKAPPHEFDEAGTTLRAAAVGRPIEEVAQLVSYLGTHENEPPVAAPRRNTATGEKPRPEQTGDVRNRSEEARHDPKRPDRARTDGSARTARTGTEPRQPEQLPYEESRPEQSRRTAFARPPESGESRDPDARRAGLSGLAEAMADPARLAEAMAHPSRRVEPEPEPEPSAHVAPWTSAPAAAPPEVPRLAPPDADRAQNRTALSVPRSPVGSPLRWFAAAALFVCGVLHLPTDFAALRSGGSADAVSLVVTVLCLMFGLWLAVADTVRIWAAGAATAVGVLAAHALSGLGSADLLRSGPVADSGWASLAASGGAGVALVLAGVTLTLRRRTARQGVRPSPRRSSPTEGAPGDA
ncbi:DUF308 domain-containing protein [Streptomyces sp. NPDC058653]|uniref:DUF308 domain-containing protein n=1 Tax=Streptomyces sp. NPDC058653 TaxID=3346576 RepID=UPI00364E4216